MCPDSGLQREQGPAATSAGLREKRRFVRIGGKLSVALRHVGPDGPGQANPAILTSLSVGGARVRCSAHLEQGATVTLNLPIPSMMDPASADARVVAVSACDDPDQWELSLEFTEIDVTDLRKIAEFITERLGRERDGQQVLRVKLDLLQDLAQVFHATTDVDRILAAVVDIALELSGAESGSLLLVDRGRKRLGFEVARGPKARQVKDLSLRMGEGVAGWVAEHGRPLKLDHADQDERWAREIADQIGYVATTLLAVPLKMKEE
jgi:hypothetical protein